MIKIEYDKNMTSQEINDAEICFEKIKSKMSIAIEESESENKYVCSGLKGLKTKISTKTWKSRMRKEKNVNSIFRLLNSIEVYYCPLFKADDDFKRNHRIQIEMKDERMNKTLEIVEINSSYMHFIRFEPNITLKETDVNEIVLKFKQEGLYMSRTYGYVFLSFIYLKINIPYTIERKETRAVRLKPSDAELEMKRSKTLSSRFEESVKSKDIRRDVINKKYEYMRGREIANETNVLNQKEKNAETDLWLFNTKMKEETSPFLSYKSDKEMRNENGEKDNKDKKKEKENKNNFVEKNYNKFLWENENRNASCSSPDYFTPTESPRLSSNLEKDIIEFKKRFKEERNKMNLRMKNDQVPYAIDMEKTLLYKNQNKKEFLVDTGASIHIIFDKKIMNRKIHEETLKYAGILKKWGGIKEEKEGIIINNVLIKTRIGRRQTNIILKKVHVYPFENEFNIISTGRLIADNVITSIDFGENTGEMKNGKNLKATLSKKKDGRWFIEI